MADGIKKISENVIRLGRALTLTNSNVADYSGIPSGSLRAVADTRGLQYKISNNNWSKFMGEGILEFGSVTTNLLANQCVTNPKIADRAVNTRTLADNAVTTIKILDLNVTTQKLAQSCVTTPKIADLNIIAPKIADNAVIERCIMNSAVTISKIANRAVIESKIAQGAVTNYQLAHNAVQTVNILDRNVTFNKIADGAVYGSKIPNEGIDHMHIRANAITTIKVADGAVTGGAATTGTGKIAPQTITSYNIKDKSIGNIDLADYSVNAIKIADWSIENRHIVNEAIHNDKLAPNIQNVINNAVVHDSNGHARVNRSMSVGANPAGGYAFAVDGDMIANRVYNSVYMDIAEGYVPGEELKPGLIVAVREDGKVYKANATDECIVGVVSDQYAACYGATPEELKAGTKVAVGLVGKVPVKVRGPIHSGNYVCADMDGIGYMSMANKFGRIGKALESNHNSTEDEVKEILCLIFPN